MPVALPGVTVAVNVKGSPTGEGFCDDVITMVEPARTVWVKAAEVADALLASPL